MTVKPTYDDANLILRLYETRREEKMRAAREWFAQNFKYHTMEEFNRGCPPGSSMNAYARMVMSYWEMAASFVLRGILNEELFWDNSGEMWFVLAKLQPFLKEVREKANIPHGFLRVEKLATQTKDGRDRLQMFLKRAEAMRARSAKAT